MTKRQRFLATSVLLALGFVFVVYLNFDQVFIPIVLLTLATLLLFIWSLKDGLSFDARMLTLILPMMFTLGVGLFWFLLPSTLWARLPIIVLYGVGMYALSLTCNIYTVSAIRTIALLRAAKSVGFVISLFTSFLLFDAIISLKTSMWVSTISVFFVSFLLYLPGIWVSKLGPRVERKMIHHALTLSYATTAIAALLYFWPVTVVIGSIFLTVSVYVLLGLAQAYWDGRLFSSVVREYLVIGVIVFLAMIFATTWRG